MNRHWDPPSLVLCQQWHELGQNSAKNVSFTHWDFPYPLLCQTMTQIRKKVSTMCQHWGSPYPLLCQQWHCKLGKNCVNNVLVLGFSISIIMSTMTQIGIKLCQQCVSIGVLHIHYCVNNNTNWRKLCQQCVHTRILNIHYYINNDTNCVNDVSIMG